MSTYKIVRMYAGDLPNEVLETGLTWEEAKEHCNDPESSSRTCSEAEGLKCTEEKGPWFEGFYEE